jgi:LysM repeat protein
LKTRPAPSLLLGLLLLIVAGILVLAACGPATGPGTRERVVAATRSSEQESPALPPAPPTQDTTVGESKSTATATAPRRVASSQATATVTPATRAARATPTATASPTPTYAAHIVQEAETVAGIAARYGISVDAVVQANNLANPNLVTQGQQLLIPPATGENVLPALPTRDYGYAIVGFSGQGRPLEVFSFGEGATDIVLVGGVHGGYEWNTVLLAYQMIDYFYGNQNQIPATVTLHIIPVANPDGLYLVTGQTGRFSASQVAAPPRAARFNGRGVDVNRNWSCGWSPSARWGGTRVDPGSEPFSEPETRALRDFFLETEPAAVIFWHSQANLVAPGRCGGDAGSAELAEVYGEASGYPPGAFTAYELSGTASDWLNEQGVPAATVELADHENTASGQNLAGIFALLDHYGGRAAAD